MDIVGARHVGQAVISAAILIGLSGGFLLGRPAGASTSQPRLPAATVAARPPPGLDLDADGQADLARPIDHPARGVDAYGSGAFGAPRDGGRRAHNGLDLVARRGEPVRAPIAGVVSRVGFAYRGDPSLTYVEVTNPITRYTARILDVAPEVRPGGAVAAGEVIGRAQDLTRRYPAGMVNHVHVEIIGRRGDRLNPLVVLPGPDGRALFAVARPSQAS